MHRAHADLHDIGVRVGHGEDHTLQLGAREAAAVRARHSTALLAGSPALVGLVIVREDHAAPHRLHVALVLAGEPSLARLQIGEELLIG